jgi:hypothetical protein
VRKVFWLLLILMIAFFLNNQAVAELFRHVNSGPETLLLGTLLGVVIGQINLISIWAAMAQGPIIVRLPWAYLLVVLVWVSVLLPNLDKRIANEDIATVGFLLAAGCTVAQLPLWIARRGFGWQLVIRRSVDESPETSSYSLTHMFVGILILAVTLEQHTLSRSGLRRVFCGDL